MLKAIVSYSKKIPADKEYSSQGYSLSLETELPQMDAKAIQARLHDTFTLVKNAVEQELENGKVAKPVHVPDVPENQLERPRDTEKASNRQIQFVTSLASQRKITISELNAKVKDLYGVESIYDLSKRDASKLVDVLKTTEGRRKAA